MRIRLVSAALLLLTGCSGPTVTVAGLASLSGTQSRQAASSGLSVFAEPESGSTPIIAAITQAKHSVKLAIYLFEHNAPATQAIEAALVAAAKRQVQVQVMLNAQFFAGEQPPVPHGTEVPQLPRTGGTTPVNTINSPVFDYLKGHGVAVQWTNPAYGITHEKVMLVDDAEAFIMTTNFTRPAVAGKGPVVPGEPTQLNREFDVVDRSPADVAELARCFAADWARTAYTPPSAGPLVISPVTSRPKLTALIDSARTEILSYQEELADPELLAHLQDRATHHCVVKLLIPDTAKLSPAQRQKLAAIVAPLTKAGVQVRRPGSADLYIHAKTFSVDGRQTYVGSINISTYSLDHNREVGLITDDAGIRTKVAGTFASDWASAQPLGL
jgi:cardiolipin synthase